MAGAGAGEDAAAHLAPPRMCADSLLGEASGRLGVFFFGCVVLGTRLDAVWCGWAMRLRAGGRCVRRIARCVREGRAAMGAGNYIGREGAASLAPALEKMPQLTSLKLWSDSEDPDEYEEQKFD